MKQRLVIFVFLMSFKTILSNENCHIDFQCNYCLPDYMPMIMSHVINDGFVTIPHGEEIIFHCHRTKFKLYPNTSDIKVTCDNGSYKVLGDSTIYHIADFSCQSDYFEDALHHVDGCSNLLQGRSYQYFNSISSSTKHLVEVCYDAEQGRTAFAHMTFFNLNELTQKEHIDNYNKISILESFSRLTDDSTKLESEKVYINDEILFKKMQNIIGAFNFADYVLKVTKLLPSKFFYGQNGMVTNFQSNKIAVWNNIIKGNLNNIHKDIFETFYNSSNLINIDIYAGTHNVLSLSTDKREEYIFLKPRKYPVPKFIYNIVYDKTHKKAVVIILLNNPFIAISEIRTSVFCPSVCNLISWIKNVKYDNNYERTAYGLVFCCDLHSFANHVGTFSDTINDVPLGERGLLK